MCSPVGREDVVIYELASTTICFSRKVLSVIGRDWNEEIWEQSHLLLAVNRQSTWLHLPETYLVKHILQQLSDQVFQGDFRLGGCSEIENMSVGGRLVSARK
jgi:hypothetical protein